ncbi:O-antigen ligase family protein [Mycobacterium sp. SM3041]|uniref:O-antigen ligase family protein n=1 Tax=Mycobacterium sp. SM3041 TaxID=3114291 RepID=UPI003204743E
MLLTEWGNTPEQWSGFQLYMTALVSFGVGRWVSENLDENSEFVLAAASLAACTMQLIVTAAQSRGVMLIAAQGPNVKYWIDSDRMVGLYSHPSVLGKTVFLLLCLLLPLSASPNSAIRRMAYASMILGSIATLLTLSRANTIAIVIAIALWALLGNRAKAAAHKFGVVAAAAVTIILTTNLFDKFELRQLRDPEGGARKYLLTSGLEQIERAPFVGTGPNYYSEFVGRYDHLVATGFPLHNSFLFIVAELGIPLAIALLIPVVMAFTQAVKPHADSRFLTVRSAAYWSTLPGVFIIGATGWGMAAKETLPLWFFVTGFLAARAAATKSKDSMGEQRDITVRTSPTRVTNPT